MRLAVLLIGLTIPASAQMQVYVDGNNTAADQVRKILAKGKTACIVLSKNQTDSDANLQVAQAERNIHGISGWRVSALLVSKGGDQLMSDSETYPKRIVQEASKAACSK